MKYLSSAVATLAVAGFAALPAVAGGLAQPEPEPVIAAPPPAASPDGDWGGFYAGAQIGYADVDSNGAGLDGDGIIGGVHGGYRWDFGRTVLGGEIDIDAADVDLGGNVGKLDSVARLKLLLGADLGRTLLYATAGVAYAEASVGAADLSDNGYFGGIGLDYALGGNWTVGGEVLVHRFDDFDDSGVDLDATTVKAKVSYRF